MKSSGFLIRRFRDGDEEAICDLLVRVFGTSQPSYQIRSKDVWNYKFRENPAGFHCLVLEDTDGQIVGHYGAVLSTVILDGEQRTFAQSCDTCTDPNVRRGLRKPGLFVRIAQAYESTFAGPPDGDTVMYGLPIPDAYVVGSRYVDYWMLRTQSVLALSDGSKLPAMDPRVQVDHVTGFTDEMDVHWRRFAEQYRCVGKRDAAFLNWRFRDYPGSPYFVGIARTLDAGDFRGYAVYRTGRFLGRRTGLIMDWMVPDDDEGAAANLLAWAGWRAAQDGLNELVFLCPPTCHWFSRFQELGFRVEPTSYVMIGRPFDQRLDPAYLRQHWYYTLADLDVL